MLNTFGVHIKRIFQRFSNNINSMPQVNTEKHTRISKTKVKKFETAESLFPTVSFQVGSSPAPLTVNRGRGQREGRVPSWQEIYLFADSPLLMSSPVFNASADTDCCSLPRFFGDGVLFAAVHFCFVHLFQISPFFFYFEKQKRRMRVFHPPRCLDAKKFLIRLFVIQFFFACWVKNPMT